MKVLLYTFKNIRDFEDSDKFEELIKLSRDLSSEESGVRIIQRLLFYLVSVNDIKPDNIEKVIVKFLPEKVGGRIMTTTAQRWIEQGINQGLEQGLEQGIEQGIEDTYNKTVKKMLRKKFSIKEISEITSLSHKQINDIKSKMKN